MPTDEERREVARRMREMAEERFDFCAHNVALEIGLDDPSDFDDLFDEEHEEAWLRLADLIDPPAAAHECVPGECPLNVRHDNGRIDRGALLALLGLEAALPVAPVASAQPSDPPEPDPLLEVRDRTPHVVTYVDAECPVCGDPAISTTEEIVCNNGLCPEYGRVQENGNEYPEVDEYLREMGELDGDERRAPRGGAQAAGARGLRVRWRVHRLRRGRERAGTCE